jgi:hypothetical protein
VRQALRDSPVEPSFIETVPSKGYRFAAIVETPADAQPEARAPEPAPAELPPSVPRNRMRFRSGLAAGFVILAAGTLTEWLWLRPDSPGSEVMLAVLPFSNLTNDPGREYVADGLSEEIIASLGQINPERVLVVGRTSMLTYKGTTKSLAQIGAK